MGVWKKIRYSGRVQGVGFRYTAQRVASSYTVNGYVRNLPTGDVELVAGGEENEVRQFLETLAKRMAGYLEQTQESETAALDLNGFHIRY
jgi:acylphosphatase